MSTINCPACQRLLRVPDVLGRQLAECPVCGFSFHLVVSEGTVKTQVDQRLLERAQKKPPPDLARPAEEAASLWVRVRPASAPDPEGFYRFATTFLVLTALGPFLSLVGSRRIRHSIGAVELSQDWLPFVSLIVGFVAALFVAWLTRARDVDAIVRRRPQTGPEAPLPDRQIAVRRSGSLLWYRAFLQTVCGSLVVLALVGILLDWKDFRHDPATW